MYTPIGDPDVLDANLKHSRDTMSRQKLPIPIFDQYERNVIGKVQKIKQIWITKNGKEVPVYYGLGVITDDTAIEQILSSAIRSSCYYHSWCSKFNSTVFNELKKFPWGEDWQECKTGGKWDGFTGAIACCTPCLKFTHLFLPFTKKEYNEALVENHWRYRRNYDGRDVSAKDKTLFNDTLRMDQKKFKKMFGERFDKNKFLNFKTSKKIEQLV